MTPPQIKTSVSPRELFQRLAGGSPAELLDVRTPGEFAAAHVAGAQIIPLDQLDAAAFLKQRGVSDKPLYVLCQSGGRAQRAIEKFQRAGFNGCVLVEGGMPVESGESNVIPLMRQVQIMVGFFSATGAALALLINAWFALIPLAMGCGLLFAGITGFCGLALVLAKMPWNKMQNCQSKSCGTD